MNALASDLCRSMMRIGLTSRGCRLVIAMAASGAVLLAVFVVTGSASAADSLNLSINPGTLEQNVPCGVHVQRQRGNDG